MLYYKDIPVSSIACVAGILAEDTLRTAHVGFACYADGMRGGYAFDTVSLGYCLIRLALFESRRYLFLFYVTWGYPFDALWTVLEV